MSKKEFTYTLKIDAEINDLVAKTAQVKKSMQQVMDSGKAPGAEKIFTSIEHAIDRLRQKASTPITSAAAFLSLQRDTAAVSTQLVKLGGVIENLGDLSEAEKIDLLPANFQQKIKDAQAAVAAFATAYAAATTETKEMAEAQKDLAKAEKEQKKAEGKVSEKTALIDATKAEIAEIEKKRKTLEKFLETQEAYEKAGANKSLSGDKTGKEELKGKSLPADRAAAKGVDPNLDLKNTEAVQAKIQSFATEIEKAEQAQRRYETSLSDWEKKAQIAGQSVSNLEEKVDTLNAEFEQNKAKDAQAAYAKLRTEAGKLGIDLSNIPLDYTEQNLNELTNALMTVKQAGLDQVKQGFDTFRTELGEVSTACDKTKDSIASNKDTFVELDERAQNTQAFVQRIKAFVGIQGAANLARRAFQNAFSTIKELDAAMTEMAVVTELEVGDYWKQLPEYTDRANELGVSIKSAYESATLFYQQGLKTNEVVAMSNETLKMARIAGLSAEDATNKMTAALRGFNMELNETSAQRVADVYSELAAITASDVKEISSAMTKTASIASSAGMEFETTAAFLSQIIETTRESAETAGTALKTVIARFQELKKDPSEIGEVDGEVVDANKIETALRSVGVALRDSSGQFRELDEVFLELSSKWDGLDTNTQRYIATIAAGSRQQSRFIAMMSDYGRTQELVSAANTSAGASNKQFENTMDSLESKLNQLKNSWDTFTMSLMNNKLIKTGIDILTGLMNTINDIVATFDKVGLGGAASIGMVISALYLGDKALKVFTGSLKQSGSVIGSFGAVGSSAIKKVTGGFTKLDVILKKQKITIKQYQDQLNATNKGLFASKKYADAQEEYSNAVQKSKNQLANLHAVQKNELSTQDEINTARMAAKAAADNQTAAEMALYAVVGLTNEEKDEAVKLTAQGVAADSAAIIAKSGITAADFAQEASLRGLTAAQYAELIASKAQGKTTLGNTIYKLLNNLAIKLGAKETLAETKAKGANTIATWLQTAATWALNASMGPLLLAILAVVAALAVLVAIIFLVIAAYKQAQANSPEGKLKSAEEAAEAAAEAAEAAKEAYDGLAESFENLADKYSALEDLTQGTREWRDAIREINSEVMDLVDQYPELARLVTNENGVLKIDLDSDEAQAVLDKYENKSIEAENASLAAKINVNEKKATVSANKISSDATYGNVTNDTIQSLAQAMGSVEMQEAIIEKGEEQAIKDWLVENGKTITKSTGNSTYTYEESEYASYLADNIDALKEFSDELYAMAEQERVYKEQMAINAIEMVDATKYSEEQLRQMDVAASADFADSFTDKYEKDFSDMAQDSNSQELADAKEDVAKSLYGEDATVSGNTITYKDENGDEQTKKLTDEEFKEQWAAIQATSAMTEAFEQLPKTIDKISAEMTSAAGKAFRAMYAGKEGSAMTKTDIKAEAYTKEELNNIWGNLTLEEQKAYGSFETLWKQYSDSIAAGTAALNQAQDAFEKAGLVDAEGVGDVLEGVSMEAARGYAESMRNVYLLGAEGAAELDTSLRSMISSLDDSEKTSFISALNALDWTSVDSLESLPETLEALGVSIPKDELDAYIDKLIVSAGALRDIDVEKLKEASTTLTSLSKSIQDGTQGRSFSEEAYNALKEMAPELASKFQLGLDGQYTFLGSSMQELTDAIEQNTEALLAEATRQLSNQIAMAEITNKMEVTQGNRELSFSELAGGQGSEETMRKALEAYQNNMKANNAEIVGIEGFGNNTVVGDLTTAEMQNIFKQLVESAGKLEDYQEDYSKTAVEAAAVMYQGNTAADNAYGVEMSSSYQTSQSHQKQEFDARSAALMTQASSAGISPALINQYAKVVDSYRQGKVEYAEVLKIQRQLANTTDYTNMRKGLQGVFESVSSIKEEYDKIASGDFKGKIAVANQALAQFGIQATDAADADKYMDLLEQLSQGNSMALDQLVAIAQEQAGLSVEAYGNAYSTGWSTLSQAQVDFYEQMAAANLGYWETTAEGGQQFVWATVEELNSVADAAGTAIEAWENPYTWLYNYNEEINRLTREREKAERAYTRALEDESSSAQDLLEISKQQLDNLKEEAAIQAQSAKNAMDTIETTFAENKEFSKYVQFDAATGSITVDYEGLEASGFDSEEGSEFEEFLSVIEENRDVVLDAEEALEDIEDQVKEIKNRGKTETSDLYNSIKEGLVQNRQNEIDKLQAINDSIQEAQSALVDQMQKQIDEARQARDNEKTESEIADKETRLAYLMRDTSGGNAMEIASLQQEITDAKTSHTDSLVDQQLQSLQNANEKAAEQRQRQIDIAQLQLDSYANSQAIWTEVKTILDSSLKEASSSSNFSQTWMNTQAGIFASMSGGIENLNPIEAQELEKELTNNAKLAALYTGVANLDGTSTTLADEAENTTTAINDATTEITNIKDNAGNFGKIGNADLQAGIDSITGSGKTNLGVVNQTVAGVTSAVDTKVKPQDIKDLFKSPINVEIVEDVETKDEDSLTEAEKKEQAQHDALQKGISAMTSFTSGGAEHVTSSSAWKKAEEEYKKAGGTESFYDAVSGKILSGDSSYSYGAHYDPSVGGHERARITTGTFPGAKVEGMGAYWGNEDTVTITLAGGGSVDADIDMANALNKNIAEAIDKLYANEGMSPEDAWIALYKGTPVIRKDGQWRKFTSGTNSKVKTLMEQELNPLYHYKTGGLADFTGPAWLDGTKSKPEIVLNQKDTANFIILKDILSEILSGTSDLSKTKDNEKGGDNYYDVEINVDSLGDDYDVEQLADKIRGMIYDDATYRNVNAINK